MVCSAAGSVELLDALRAMLKADERVGDRAILAHARLEREVRVLEHRDADRVARAEAVFGKPVLRRGFLLFFLRRSSDPKDHTEGEEPRVQEFHLRPPKISMRASCLRRFISPATASLERRASAGGAGGTLRPPDSLSPKSDQELLAEFLIQSLQ